jgi:predicted ATP-binding protein involved in virulence
LLRNVNYELFASYHTDPGAFQHLKNIIFQVTDGRICDIQVSGRNITFKEKLDNSDEVEPMPLDKLAAGYRNIINLAFDIYSRLKSVHEKSLYYGDYFGIVLIDEFENHLHPIFQRKLPVLLSKVFPRVQFIVSTHSPIPLLAAEKTSMIIKVNRTTKEGITLERLDDKINISALLPNILLTSPIFGFEDIFPDSKDDTVFPRTEDTYQEAKDNDLQNQQIKNFFDRDKTREILNTLKGSSNA